MKVLLRVGLALIVALGLGSARASTNSTDITDMWWNPAESGWGVNIILQNDVAFMTFFVYDTTSTPIWYTSDIHYQGIDGTGALVWTGNLYATTGPWFGGPFPPSNVTRRQAGTVSFALSSIDQATLSYSVDGVVVTRALERQTWTSEDYTGTYVGGFSIQLSSCNPASLNGLEEDAGTMSVSHNGSSISFVLTGTTDTCSFTGTYAQTGKLGQTQGSYSCASGISGTFSAAEMNPTISGFTARVNGQNQFCDWSGTFGGIRRAQ